ncbi:MAG: tetratricopeptide repeat protein [Spirochaetes bacterium]|nr:tetratricopeptide repeat protein [Spirochaetota bacterium]
MKKIRSRHPEKRLLKNRIIFLLFLFILSSSLFSMDVFQFGLSLYKENDFYRAISEFNRYLFYYPQGKNVDQSFLYIVKSYYFAEQFDKCILVSKEYSEKTKKESLKDKFKFYMASSYLKSEKLKEAGQLFSSLSSDSDKEMKEFGLFRLGWVYLFQKQWQKAADHFNQFEKQYPDSRLVTNSQLIRKQVLKGIDFTPRSPVLAGIMSSLFPGLGQIYCKRVGDGLVALLFVGSLTYGSYYYYNNGPNEMFYGFAFLNLLFYTGNIFTAVSSAHKYNRNFNDHLKITLFNYYFEDYDL